MSPASFAALVQSDISRIVALGAAQARDDIRREDALRNPVHMNVGPLPAIHDPDGCDDLMSVCDSGKSWSRYTTDAALVTCAKCLATIKVPA